MQMQMQLGEGQCLVVARSSRTEAIVQYNVVSTQDFL